MLLIRLCVYIVIYLYRYSFILILFATLGMFLYFFFCFFFPFFFFLFCFSLIFLFHLLHYYYYHMSSPSFSATGFDLVCPSSAFDFHLRQYPPKKNLAHGSFSPSLSEPKSSRMIKRLSAEPVPEGNSTSVACLLSLPQIEDFIRGRAKGYI